MFLSYSGYMGVEAVIGWIAKLMSPCTETPSLDVAANREHLRSGDRRRILLGLRFLGELGSAARDAREELEVAAAHEDPEIAATARAVLDGLPD